MAIGLESHGLPAASPYGPSVTVQDHQGEGHGQQQPAQDAGYSNASAFEPLGPSTPGAAIEEQAPEAGGDLLSRLGGFIRAVGEVVVQLGEYLRTAGGALNPEAAPEVATPAPQAGPTAATPAPAPALGTAATVPGQPALAGAPAQQATATQLPVQGRPTMPDLRGGGPVGTRSTETLSPRQALQLSAEGLGAAAASLSVATGGARGGGAARSSQASGFPVLNPLPPYLGDSIAPLFDFSGNGQEGTPVESGSPFQSGAHLEPGQLPVAAELHAEGFTSRPPVQPLVYGQVAPATETHAAEQAASLGFASNVLPFPSSTSTTRSGFQAEASNENTSSEAPPEADPSSNRYSAIVFRPAFYGNLRC